MYGDLLIGDDDGYSRTVRRQAGDFLFSSYRSESPWRAGNGAAHGDADPHGESVRVSYVRLFPFLECDSMVSDILSSRSERMSAKKGSAAARFRPKLITVSANGPQLAPFGRSDTASRLHAETVPSFPLRGRPPTERAGSWTNVRLHCTYGAGFMFDASVSHTPVRAHIEKNSLLLMAGEVWCRRFAAPLY